MAASSSLSLFTNFFAKKQLAYKVVLLSPAFIYITFKRNYAHAHLCICMQRCDTRTTWSFFLKDNSDSGGCWIKACCQQDYAKC